MINRINLVLIQLNKNANFIQPIYTGFNKDGAIAANRKKVAEIIETGSGLCLCLIKITDAITRKNAPMVMPNFLNDFLSRFMLSICIKLI